MPSFERTKGDEELRFEILLDDKRVYVCELYRSPGANTWTTKASNPRCYFADDAAKAKELYEKKLKLPKAYQRVGEDAPEAEKYRDKSNKERNALFDAMAEWETKHHQVEVLDKTGRVYWVGQEAGNEKFMEITLEGTTVTVRKGTIGKGKGSSEKVTHPDRAAALRSATISMMTAMDILGLGPKT